LATLQPSQVPPARPPLELAPAAFSPQPNGCRTFSAASTADPAAGDSSAGAGASPSTVGGRATPRGFALGHAHSSFNLVHRMQHSDSPSQRHFSFAFRQAAHARFLGAFGSHAMPNRLHRAQREPSAIGTAGSVREQLHFDF
jgi:hypothetical protein